MGFEEPMRLLRSLSGKASGPQQQQTNPARGVLLRHVHNCALVLPVTGNGPVVDRDVGCGECACLRRRKQCGIPVYVQRPGATVSGASGKSVIPGLREGYSPGFG